VHHFPLLRVHYVGKAHYAARGVGVAVMTYGHEEGQQNGDPWPFPEQQDYQPRGPRQPQQNSGQQYPPQGYGQQYSSPQQAPYPQPDHQPRGPWQRQDQAPYPQGDHPPGGPWRWQDQARYPRQYNPPGPPPAWPPQPESGMPPAGWYPDPVNQQELRWWDGTRWGPLAPRANSVPTADGPWPADRPGERSASTATPSPSTSGLVGRDERGMLAAPGQPYASRSQYNGVRQTKNTRTMIAVGAALALALVVAGIAVASRSAGGSGSTATPKSASAVPGTPSDSAATVLVLGSRSVTQINGVTQTVVRSYAVQPSDGSSGDGEDQGVAFAMTSHGLTAYVVVNGGVVPIDLATHTVGELISIGTSQINAIAASPDGMTVYVASGEHNPDDPGEVTPIDTQVNQARQPITVGMEPDSIAFAPDGKTAYVADNDNFDVVPINVTTGIAGQPIRVQAGGGTTASIVFTPDGKTAYVGTVGGQVAPIDVSEGVAEAPLPGSYSAMAITPDGKTLYVLGAGNEVTPVNTATNTLGPRLTIKAANDGDELLMSPDGKSLYLLNESGVLTVISTETGTVGKPISMSSGGYPRSVAITPDGKTLYITEHKDLVPFNTESQAVGKPIKLSDFPDFYGGLFTAGTAQALP